jgi:hypothetical protein
MRDFKGLLRHLIEQYIELPAKHIQGYGWVKGLVIENNQPKIQWSLTHTRSTAVMPYSFISDEFDAQQAERLELEFLNKWRTKEKENYQCQNN